MSKDNVEKTKEELKQEIDKLPDEMVKAINRITQEKKLGFGHPDFFIENSEFLREALRDKITKCQLLQTKVWSLQVVHHAMHSPLHKAS